tara:strand:- start:2934 stop:3338 length:405 start_codon:yes stop_codon:yes gene_type:complete
MIKAEVYYNVHKKCLSIRDTKTNKVVKHTHAVRVKGGQDFYKRVNFVVQPSGRKRVLKQKKKNVHAFVRGMVDLSKTPSLEERKLRKPKTVGRVKYNPYKYETFVDAKTEKEAHYAKEVFIEDRSVFIVKPHKN